MTVEEIARCRARPFPVMPNMGSYARRTSSEAGRALDSVPWYVAERAWRAYDAKYQCGQTAEQLARRGGFSEGELDEFYPEWREAAGATAREVLDHIQAVAAHPDPATAIAEVRRVLKEWR